MKLTDLIKYLDNDESLNSLYREFGLNINSEAVIAYMENELDLNSEIIFLDVEETKGELEFEKNGKKHIELFPLNLGVEFYSYFDDYFLENHYTNEQKAQRLLEYRINDA